MDTAIHKDSIDVPVLASGAGKVLGEVLLDIGYGYKGLMSEP
jgi:hypothetical protein